MFKQAEADEASAWLDSSCPFFLFTCCCSCLKFSDETVRRHAAACLRDVVRHSAALATAVAEAPCDALNQLAAYAVSTSSVQALPALTALGFAAEHSPKLAAKVAAAPGALAALSVALQCGDENCQAAAAWALGRVGSQGPPTLVAAVATSLPRLCVLVGAAPADSTLHTKCLKAAGSIIRQHTDVAQLAALVMQPGLVPHLLEQLLARCAAVMAKQPATRAAFASSGALAYLEAWKAGMPADSAVGQHAAACLRLFPEVKPAGGRPAAPQQQPCTASQHPGSSACLLTFPLPCLLPVRCPALFCRSCCATTAPPTSPSCCPL